MSQGLPRSQSLDLLRGLAILGMLFAGIIPWSGLPQWMYHGQEPPAPAVQGLPRLSWVDLVFPFFLFALGAAIPFALRGPATPRAIGRLAGRAILLFALAFVNEHLRPYAMAKEPGTHEWLVGLLGFALTLGAFVGLPKGWTPLTRGAARVAAWGGILLLVSRLNYASGEPGWNAERSDPILRVLAFASAAGSGLWLATRDRPLAQVASMVTIVGLCLAAKADGASWQHRLWIWGVPYLFDLPFLGYLLVVIPGIFAGEALSRLEQEPAGEPEDRGDPLLTALLVATIGFELALLFIRTAPFPLAALPLLLVLARSVRLGPEARLMLRGGVGLVALGFLIEPLDGGVRKDPWTLAYVLLTPGLALLAIVAILAAKRVTTRIRAARTLAEVGANPLLAYTAITNLWAPLWALTVGGFVAGITPGPTLGLLRAAAETALFALIVAGFTRLRITMRT